MSQLELSHSHESARWLMTTGHKVKAEMATSHKNSGRHAFVNSNACKMWIGTKEWNNTMDGRSIVHCNEALRSAARCARVRKSVCMNAKVNGSLRNIIGLTLGETIHGIGKSARAGLSSVCPLRLESPHLSHDLTHHCNTH